MKKDVFAKPFGEMLKKKRTELGISQETVAARSGRSLRFIQCLEAGHSEPTLSTIYALAHAFDVRVVDLLAALPKDLNGTDSRAGRG